MRQKAGVTSSYYCIFRGLARFIVGGVFGSVTVTDNCTALWYLWSVPFVTVRGLQSALTPGHW